tara:strand:+ start:471 stop:821 length:351 start_codon:yes stop_codon:yes gene_type:complete
MDLIKKTDKDILKIADPLWKELINSSNKKDYNAFTRNFSKEMLLASNEVEIGKQWTRNEVLTSLSDDYNYLGCLRRNNFVTVLYRQRSNTVDGDFLGRLVLGVEEDEVKIFGATIF